FRAIVCPIHAAEALIVADFVPLGPAAARVRSAAAPPTLALLPSPFPVPLDLAHCCVIPAAVAVKSRPPVQNVTRKVLGTVVVTVGAMGVTLVPVPVAETFTGAVVSTHV